MDWREVEDELSETRDETLLCCPNSSGCAIPKTIKRQELQKWNTPKLLLAINILRHFILQAVVPANTVDRKLTHVVVGRDRWSILHATKAGVYVWQTVCIQMLVISAYNRIHRCLLPLHVQPSGPWSKIEFHLSYNAGRHQESWDITSFRIICQPHPAFDKCLDISWLTTSSYCLWLSRGLSIACAWCCFHWKFR